MKNRWKKRCCAAALLLMMAMTVSLFSAGVSAVGGFSDVREGDWFCRPVLWAVEESITNGTSETTFSPDQICSRAQILTFLWRAAGEPKPEMFCPFYDVSAADYFCDAATWAYENGLVEGMLFSGSTMCARADVVTYLWKLSGMPYAEPAAFTDVPAASQWAQPVAWAVGQGITEGMGDGRFSPQGVCTRGQIVTFLYRAFAENELPQQVPSEEAEDEMQPEEGVTQSSAAGVLYGLLDTYPEGAWWNIESSYSSEALNLAYAGCAGFALYCSDLIFGDLPITEVHSDFDRIKVGDMVRDEAGRHTVMVLEKKENSIIVVEGNYNDTVHWYREMFRTDEEFYNFTVTTRYP